MWCFQHSRYTASGDRYWDWLISRLQQRTCRVTYLFVKWAFRKLFPLGTMSGYSTQLFKRLIVNVPGGTAFIPTVYKQSGLGGYTPSHNLTPTFAFPTERLMASLTTHAWSEMLVNTLRSAVELPKDFSQYPSTTFQSGRRMLARYGAKHRCNLAIQADPTGGCRLHIERGLAETCSSVKCGMRKAGQMVGSVTRSLLLLPIGGHFFCQHDSTDLSWHWWPRGDKQRCSTSILKDSIWPGINPWSIPGCVVPCYTVVALLLSSRGHDEFIQLAAFTEVTENGSKCSRMCSWATLRCVASKINCLINCIAFIPSHLLPENLHMAWVLGLQSVENVCWFYIYIYKRYIIYIYI